MHYQTAELLPLTPREGGATDTYPREYINISICFPSWAGGLSGGGSGTPALLPVSPLSSQVVDRAFT